MEQKAGEKAEQKTGQKAEQKTEQKAELQTEQELLMAEIVKKEWEQFDKVVNTGGRAGCQDDWETFDIMRRSQFSIWSTEALQSYLDDLTQAEEKGRNLLSEKYAYMMQDTAPEEYKQIADRLPALSEEKKKLVTELTELQTRWMEVFHRTHPYFGGRGRAVRKTEAYPGDASVETYAMGELSTYSEKTLRLLNSCMETLQAEQEHPEILTMDYMARCYGYQSAEDAEQRFKQSSSQSM